MTESEGRARKAAEAILLNLSCRRHFGSALAALDEERVQELVRTLTSLILAAWKQA